MVLIAAILLLATKFPTPTGYHTNLILPIYIHIDMSYFDNTQSEQETILIFWEKTGLDCSAKFNAFLLMERKEVLVICQSQIRKKDREQNMALNADRQKPTNTNHFKPSGPGCLKITVGTWS